MKVEMILISRKELRASTFPPPPLPTPATAAAMEIYGCTHSNLLYVLSGGRHSCTQLLCQENVTLHLIA